MTFEEVLTQIRELLEREGRVSYRALKRRFSLDDDYLEDLKDEIIKAKRWAKDEEGAVLVWTGAAPSSDSTFQVSDSQLPAPSTQLLTLSTQTLDTPRQPLDSARSEAERRHLTVMFCDVVGSTALSAQLDPEEWREVVRAYQQTCAEVIGHFDGYIAQYLGDGLLVYFGYPLAHEDDAARAVRAGLGIVVGMQELNRKLQSPLQIRIGIHTGTVVVGEIGGGERREQLALGEAPNIAARIQGLAEPDTVAVSNATHRLIEGFFVCRSLGAHTVKGIAAPVEVYQVVEESGIHSRLEAAAARGLAPLVGRDLEIGLLQERWAQAKAGEGQVVVLSGEAGIGKSRLVQVLKEQVNSERTIHIEFRCSAYHQNSAFYPILGHLQRLLQFAPYEAPHTKLAKLQQALAAYRFPQADTLPLLAALLSLPHPTDYPPLNLSPQKQKEKTLETLIRWMVEETEKTVVYCAWEDLHWADPSTLELLHLFLDHVPTTRLLVLLTCRPEFSMPWSPRSYLTQLTLSRLGRLHVERIVENLTGGKSLPVKVLQQIVHKTDGVPLFVEELTKMVLESGLLRPTNDHYELLGPLPSLAIPSTLHDSLMARLDRLAPVRELAQVGATLGREFSYSLIHAVSSLDEAILQQGLRQLVEAELLHQRGLPPHALYFFKHALVQETAYQSLLKSRRQHLHQQIAQALERQFPEPSETQPELLAHHYTEAGLTAEAIPHWHRAGQRAIARSANAEAMSHLTKGLALLTTLPDTPERIQHELTLQITLGVLLMMTKGYAAAEVEHAFARARELCQQIGDAPPLFPVFFGLWVFHFVRAELQMARELGEQLLRLAQSVQDPGLLLQAHDALGHTLFHLGDLISAQSHLEQSIALYDPQQHQSHALLYGQDPKVVCLSYAALVLWLLGFPDQAAQKSQEAVTLAQHLAHPHSLAFALDLAAVLHQHRRERQAAQEQAEALLALATEQGFMLFVARGTFLRAWTLAGREQRENGIAQMNRSLAAYRATGAALWQPYFLALLAHSNGADPIGGDDQTVVADSLTMAQTTGERWYEAEAYRLKGELTLQQECKVQGSKFQDTDPRLLSLDPQGEAEACFLKAIQVAQRQQAKSLELRATVSLARLWRQQSKKVEARQMLSEIYAWFTEGFDTVDLQEAQMLLQELEGGVQ